MEKLNNACLAAYVYGKSAACSFGRSVKNRVKGVANDESGMEIIAIVLILVVVIGLVIIFREKIFKFFGDIWDAIFGKEDEVTKTN